MSYGLVMWLGGTAFGFAVGSLLWLGIGALVNRIHRKPPHAPPPSVPIVVATAEAILRDAAREAGAQ